MERLGFDNGSRIGIEIILDWRIVVLVRWELDGRQPSASEERIENRKEA